MRRRTGGAFGSFAAFVSLGLGVLGLGAVLCLLFPAALTTPELRAVYPMHLVRKLIQLVIASAFMWGLIGMALWERPIPALAGALLAVAATLLGGATIPVRGPVQASPHLGLDWFLLDLFVLAIVYVPIERLFPRVVQPILRAGFATDLTHFFVNHLLVHVFVFLAVYPASEWLRWVRFEPVVRAVGSQPVIVQVVEIVVVADLFQYGIHRLFHQVPLLWRVHAVHHSSRHLDWLAGSRLHLVDIVVVRAVTFVPLFVLGFADAAIRAYVVVVAVHAVFLHANVRFRFGRLEKLVTTPRYHHFHHAADGDAVDKNFAFHLPFIDRLFGTQHLPSQGWPEGYGVGGDSVPTTWARQLVHPFRASWR